MIVTGGKYEDEDEGDEACAGGSLVAVEMVRSFSKRAIGSRPPSSRDGFAGMATEQSSPPLHCLSSIPCAQQTSKITLSSNLHRKVTPVQLLKA